LSALNTSIAGFQAHTDPQNPKSHEDLLIPVSNWVDVRDVALVHVVALEKEEAGGERFITSSGPFTYQDVREYLRLVQPGSQENSPDLLLLLVDALHASTSFSDVPKGQPGAGKSIKANVFSAAKAEKVLGIKFKTLEETAADTLRALRERGF
jgi:nucleoside-diphosphate-sugar epimerase